MSRSIQSTFLNFFSNSKIAKTLKKKLVPTINDASIVYNEPKAQNTPAAEIIEPSYYTIKDAPETKQNEDLIITEEDSKEKIVEIDSC